VNAGVPLVEGNVGLVAFDRAVGPIQRGVDVAKQFDGEQGIGVKVHGLAKVSQGGLELALTLVHGSTLEVGKHRVGFEGNGARIGFNRLKMAIGGDMLVPFDHPAVELPLVSQGGVGKGPGHAGHGHEHYRHEGSAHGDDGSKTGRNFRGGAGSNLDTLTMGFRIVAESVMKDAGALGWAEVGNREAALIERCAAGEQAACAELVSGHERMVYQLALHLLGDRDEALDLSQEVFFSVFRTIGHFRGQSALKTWIYRIVINQARNRQRWWRRRHKADQVSLDQHVAAHGDLRQPGEHTSPDRAYARKELAEKLWTALDRLPFDQRTVIILREIDGLSYDDIAFSLGVAVGTVKSRLTRARQALRQQLQGVRV
jgi:RNA polymerase sigma-70 factor (ECF subfamily)